MSTDLNAVKESCEDSLIAIQNVNGVGVGVKWVNGVPTDTPAILVFVQEKLPEDGVLHKFDASQLVPQSIDGIPTDVIEVGEITKQGFNQRVRPIKPGYSTGHGNITAGTIGGIFTDKDGQTVVLSNNHVLANENRAKPGDLIYQPGPMDNRSVNKSDTSWREPISNLPFYATLKSFVPIGVGTNNLQDSAIAVIHDNLVRSGMVDPVYPSINKPLRAFGTPAVNQQVQKCGRTTGYTTGRVMALNSSFTIKYEIGNIRFGNCVVCSAMSAGGDSGSVILDMNMNAVALLFAGSPKVTIATPIQGIVSTYGLKVWTPPRIIRYALPSMELDDNNWTIATAHGTIVQGLDSISVSCPANAYCVMQRPLDKFETVSVAVNTGTDTGNIYGPGIVIHFPNGFLKLALAHGGSFLAMCNGSHAATIGRVSPRTEYRIRIRRSDDSYYAEVQDADTWILVMQVPVSVVGDTAVRLMIGKTNMAGDIGDSDNLGEMGDCSFRDLDVT
jgi:hypothetical protein